MLLQMLGVQQFARLHGLFLVLIAVKGRDALLGRAVLLIRKPRFLQCIQLPVPGQQQRGAVADLQVIRRNGDACGTDGVHFAQQVLAVQRYAVAENIDNAVPEDTAGQQVQGELALLVDHGMSCVAAALIANDNVIVVCQVVHHTALALVTPVDAYDRTICHE